MSKVNTSIVIGYGAFGLQALRRLLAGAASRGALTWEAPEGAEDPGRRHLRDLGLIWVPEISGLEEREIREEVGGGASFEMMQDLYRQILTVPAGPGLGAALAETVDAEARQLLKASRRSLRSESRPLMLNVIVLAQPSSARVVGALNDILAPAMDRLSEYVNLTRSLEGSDLLNFLQLLDFADYWSGTPQALEMRRAMQRAVDHWQSRIAEGRPGFGRIYLTDSHTRDGVRDGQQRQDEMGLFLELLLFESGDPGLESLFRRQRDILSPLGSFGIRLIERSSGLLSRLAAARFAEEWIPFLDSDTSQQPEDGLGPLREQIAPFLGDSLQGLLAAEDLKKEIDASFQQLEGELQAIPVDLPDWSQQVRRRCKEGADKIRNDLYRLSGERLSQIRRESLEPFPKRLQDAVSQALGSSARPASLASVLQELESAADQIQSNLPRPPDEKAEPPPDEPAPDQDWQALKEAQAQYHRFRASQVDAARHRSRWPLLLALILAVAISPLAPQAIAAWEGHSNHILRSLHEWLSSPIILLPLLSLAFFGIAFLAVPSSILKRVQFGLRFFTDKERGRLSAALRQLLAPGGPVRSPVDEMISRRVEDFSYSVRGSVGSELQRVIRRLRERRREMLWLRQQLREFLRMHGIDSQQESPGFELSRQDQSGVRHSLERLQDLSRILAYNPPQRDRFRSTQSEFSPFEGWQEQYCETFLHPIDFLDRLSLIYQERVTEREEGQLSQGQEEWLSRLVEFISKSGRFDVGFIWAAAEGHTVRANYCVMPPAWSRLQGVRAALEGQAFTEARRFAGEDPDRAYLLRVQLAIPPEHLLEGE